MKWCVVESPTEDEGNQNQQQQHYLVLACMHGGCRIYKLNIQESPLQGSISFSIVSFVHHTDLSNDKHLAYGIDVLHHNRALKATSANENCANGGGDDATVITNEFTIASCSFYDNLVQIWNAVI